MQAVILSGGEGARLKPYTTILPKPLMPIGNKAVLELVLLQLKNAGFKEYVFSVGYLAELIEAYFRNGSKWGVRIRYSRENKPLGTAGPLSIIDKLDDNFLVMNGDILCDINYRDLYKRHCRQKGDITLCSYKKKIKIDLGVLNIQNNKLSDYIEKPEYMFQVSMGIYMLNKRIIKHIPKNKKYDFPALIKDKLNTSVRMNIYRFRGQWYDIGRIDDYQLVLSEYVNNPGMFLKQKKEKE